MYSSGLNLAAALRVLAKSRFLRDEDGILNQNPIFEIASKYIRFPIRNFFD